MIQVCTHVCVFCGTEIHRAALTPKPKTFKFADMCLYACLLFIPRTRSAANLGAPGNVSP